VHIDKSGETPTEDVDRNETKQDDEEDVADADSTTAVNTASAMSNTGKKHKLFCGWIAFCLYSPHAPAKMQLDLLKLVENKQKEGNKTRGWAYG